MTIPAFSATNVLPPYVGTWPSAALGFSPYEATMAELSVRLATSPARRTILTGLLDLRSALRNLGLSILGQWVDGSFTEEIEVSEGRDPGDVDVVSFLNWPLAAADPAAAAAALAANQNVFDHAQCKATYRCDHYMLDMAPGLSIDQVCYWHSAFSHRRNGAWKGYVRVLDECQAIDDQLKADLVAQGLVP